MYATEDECGIRVPVSLQITFACQSAVHGCLFNVPHVHDGKATN